jgi:hypothetical protein
MPKRTDIQSILIIGAGPMNLLPLPLGERAGVSGLSPGDAGLDCRADGAADTFEIAQYLIVPEVKNDVAVSTETGVALSIALAPMLPSIDLDDQRCLDAEKVDRPSVDGYLALELESVEAPVSEGEPQLSLGVSHPLTKIARPLDSSSLHNPLTLTLSPRGEGTCSFEPRHAETD